MKSFIFACLLLTSSFSLYSEELTLLPEGQKAALRWVHLIDKGLYAQAWEEGSSLLKLTMPKMYWPDLLNAIRGDLGTVINRQTVAVLPSENPPNLPKGKYVAIFYQTEFGNAKQVIELVTLVLESDNKWKVVTYMAGRKKMKKDS